MSCFYYYHNHDQLIKGKSTKSFNNQELSSKTYQYWYRQYWPCNYLVSIPTFALTAHPYPVLSFPVFLMRSVFLQSAHRSARSAHQPPMFSVTFSLSTYHSFPVTHRQIFVSTPSFIAKHFQISDFLCLRITYPYVSLPTNSLPSHHLCQPQFPLRAHLDSSPVTLPRTLPSGPRSPTFTLHLSLVAKRKLCVLRLDHLSICLDRCLVY